MAGGYLFGWDGDSWEKVLCNSDGKLIIDPTLILEDTPTDGELEKAPTSNWAYDHAADVDAHHVAYTDEKARAAINDILDSDGRLTGDLYFQYKGVTLVRYFHMENSFADAYFIEWVKGADDKELRLMTYEKGVGYVDCNIWLYQTDHYVKVIHDDSFQTALALYLEEAPTNGVVNKAPTSNWAYDHDADADAHHTKYTDAEAQTACNLDGDLYLSIPGTAWTAYMPDSDAVSHGHDGQFTVRTNNRDVRCAVMLPHGATVTAVLVDGDAGASSRTWTMYQVGMSDQTNTVMASATVQTEDTTISNAVIDNSLYYYWIDIRQMDAWENIYYARIKYTL